MSEPSEPSAVVVAAAQLFGYRWVGSARRIMMPGPTYALLAAYLPDAGLTKPWRCVSNAPDEVSRRLTDKEMLRWLATLPFLDLT